MGTKVILVILSFLAGISPIKDNLAKYNLKGKIWKVKETSYEGQEKLGKYQLGDKNYAGHSLYIFNENGYLTEKQTLDKEGKVNEYLKYKLDDNNNLTKKQTLNRDEEMEHALLYSYNQDGNCTGINSYQKGELISKIANEIENNQIVESKVFNGAGELIRSIQFNYSGSYISETKLFDDAGKQMYTIANKWSNDLLTQKIATDSRGEITYIRTNTWNENGDLIKRIIEYPEDSVGHTITYKYDYDDKRNWIKQYQFNGDNKIGKIRVRDIVYYD